MRVILKVRPPKYKTSSGSGIKDNSNLVEIFGESKNPSPTSDKPGFNKNNNERMMVLVQALRLTLRYIEGRSGLNKDEFKAYIETLLKVY